MDLNAIWFVLVAVLLGGYAVLDGFDLGVGVLHLFARDEQERRLHVAAIGPVWDGNEVWLLTGGGAIFAAFPAVYATVFSGFYLALVLLLVALIARAVSLEFRHQLDAPAWTRTWDWAFGVGSLLPAVLFGVAVGNVLRGVPVTADGEWAGHFLGLLNPFAVLVGVVTATLFTLHGALYLRVKTDGALASRLDRLVVPLWLAFAGTYAAATVAAAAVSPWLFAAGRRPALAVTGLAIAASAAAILLLARRGRHGAAFVASSTTILLVVTGAAISMFPRLVPSSLGLENSLTVYNAASTPRTLAVMLVVALTGMPLVLLYTAFAYRVFKGKTAPGTAYGPATAEH
jgi:cytochrome d ubiquinol oxidase subunit II